MSTFRRFTRRAWLLHGYLLASMILWPVPAARSYWTWDAGTGTKVQAPDPPLTIEGINPDTGASETIPNPWWDQDLDGDGLTNAEEVAFGSDPYCRDSDYDGLTDSDERDVTPAMLGYSGTTDPWNWDSDADGYSDHDEYWAWQSGLALNVSYYSQTTPSPLPPDYYRDLDGDGSFNLWDYAPTDSGVTSPPVAPGGGTGTSPDPSTTDSDWDGHVDASDSHPYTNWLWEDWNNNGTNDSQEPPPTTDSDWDGHYDPYDSHPYDSILWEDWNYNGINDSQESPPDPTSPPDPYYTNSDGDGVNDAYDSDPGNASLWDDWNRNGINDSSEPPDSDGDGVIDDDENTAGTNPWFHDSDGDGLSDSEERTAQTNPLLVDTDGDGLTDHEEIFIFQTNPLLSRSLPGQQQTDYHRVNLSDTDSDGIPDLVESWYGRDPASDADAGSDLDLDGHTDLEAFLAGWSFTVSFTSYDQDRDGITDARESYWGFNPYDANDATQDADHDGLLNIEEIRLGLDPLSASTHGTPDLEYVNTTWNLGWQPCLSPGSPATGLDNDTDGDGMSDAWEHRHRLNLRDPSDAIRDPDRDGLSNLTEYRFQSHPRIPKTQDNIHDRTRLYATGKPLNASTAGGLMNRYRAKMAADLAGENTLREYGLIDVKAPRPQAPQEPGPPVAGVTFTVTVTKTTITNGQPGSPDTRTESVPYTLTSPTSGGEPYMCPDGCGQEAGDCGKVDCPDCVGGYKSCGTCGGDGKMPCKGPHYSNCTGHVIVCPGGHQKDCQRDHGTVVCTVHTAFGCDDPHITCTEDHEHNSECPRLNHEQAECGDGQTTHDEECRHGQSKTCGESDCNGKEDVLCADFPGCKNGDMEQCSIPETCPQRPNRQCDSTCPPVDCDNSACNNGKVLCGAEDCDGGYLPGCICGNSECGCEGGPNCPAGSEPLSDVQESGDVSAVFENANDARQFTVFANGEEKGTLSNGGQPVYAGLAQNGDEIRISVYEKKEPPDDDGPGYPPASISTSDGAGSRYRKIGLNGLPLSDSKPQAQDESGESGEETFVDAYTRQFKHSVSDVYARAEGSELPLMVRRDASGDISSHQYGLQTHEKPFLPFGPGWTSNICAYVRNEETSTYDPELHVTTQRSQLTAIDEQGGAHGFIPAGAVPASGAAALGNIGQGLGNGNGLLWVPDGTSRSDAKSAKNRFFILGGNSNPVMVLSKKFGTTCYYEQAGIVQITSADRVNGSHSTTTTSYGRLVQVVDRHGNRLRYDYEGPGTLIPKSISDPDRPGFSIQIRQTNGLVTSVRGVDGHTITYAYPDLPLQETLGSVHRGGTAVHYGYATSYEPAVPPQTDPPPSEPDENRYTGYFHTNLTSITDESGHTYLLEWTCDHSTKHISYSDAPSVTTSYQRGLPMLLERITHPDGGVVNISGSKQITTTSMAGGGVAADFGFVVTTIKAVDDSSTTYAFANPSVFSHSYQYDGLQRLVAASFVGTFANLDVARGKGGQSLGSESYVFNPAASFALSSAKDLSQNITSFTYGTDGYDDPLTETSYLGTGGTNGTPVTKHYTYDEATRIMTSMTDPMGVRTEYTIDNSRTITRDAVTIPICGLKTAEKVFDAQNNLLRETRYSYDHPTFAGLVTKQWTISPNEEAMPSSVTITTLGDPGTAGFSDGWYEDTARTWILEDQDSTTPAYRCGWWREVTTTTGPATPGGELDASSSPSALSCSLTIADLGGKKRQVIDARGLDTTFDYDASGRLTRVDHPDETFKTLDYDAHGNLTAETDENGVTTFHRYDSLNRRIKSAVDLNGNGLPDWDTTPGEDYGSDDHSYTLAGSTPGTASSPPIYDGDLVTTTHYNSRNQITAQVDARGLLTTNAYDDAGRLESTITGGKTTLFYYDGLNNGGSIFDSSAIKPNRTTDPRGVVTTVVYDSLYRPVSSTVSDPGLEGGPMFTAVTLTEYDLNGKPTHVTDPLGRVTINEYDALGNLIKVIEPDLTTNTADNPTVQTFYTHHGKPWKVIDQMGNETTTRYDALGRPVEVKGPPLTVSSSPSLQVSAVTTTEYDAAGNAIAVTDPLGRVVETLYDERNRPTHVYAPTMWDAVSGQFVRPYAVTTYDALGQPLSVTDHTGATTTNHYDRAGRKWKVEAPAVAVSSSTSQVSSSVRPTTLTSFDPGGLPLTVTNPLNQTITNTYDIYGRLKSTLDAEGILNEFDYDAAGNRTSVKDGLNQQTTFAYDGLNRLIRQTFANGDTWTHTYNAVQKESQLSPRGILTSYTYDARDRLLTVATSGTEGGIAFPPTSRSYTYDNAGKLLTVSESGTGLQPVLPGSANVSYTYDEMGRVTAESSNNQTHQYEYDLAGNRVKATYSTGRVVETSYDGLNRPEAIVDGDRLTRYGYDKAGRAVILVAANGQTSSNTYDALGRLTDRVLYKTPAMDPAQRLAQFQWKHDLLGNVTKQEEIWPGEPGRAGELRRTTMGYDANNRLIFESIVTYYETYDEGQTTTYTYDDANNRRTKTITGGAEPGHWDYDYNAANQLTAWEHLDYPGGSVLRSASLTYDEAGNRTSQAVTQVSGSYNPAYNPQPAVSGLTTYTWDAQDRLASVTLPGQPGTENSEPRTFSYAYDYRTRRVGTVEQTLLSAAEKRTSITFSGGLSVAEYESTVPVNSSPSALSSTPTVEYTRGPDMGGGVGGLLYTSRSESASASVSSSRTLRYNLSNGRGDIVAQSDSYASLTWTASYEAYGKRTKETGENKDKQRGNSKDEDPTGLLNEGFRYRDLETGVWLSRDPAGFVDGPNLYAYVKQNPWSAFDPDGLKKVIVTGGVKTKPDKDHDNSNDHFLKASVRHAMKEQKDLKKSGSKETVSLIIYGPAYDARATEDAKTDPSKADNLQKYVKAATDAGIEVKVVSSAKEVLATAESMAKSESVSSLKYFGHSNPQTMLLDYGSGDKENISASDLTSAIPVSRTTKGFNCRLYGCDVGNTVTQSTTMYGPTWGKPSMSESLSSFYKGAEVMGSTGKSRYGDVGNNYISPSSANGYQYWMNGAPTRSDPAGERPAGEKNLTRDDVKP